MWLPSPGRSFPSWLCSTVAQRSPPCLSHSFAINALPGCCVTAIWPPPDCSPRPGPRICQLRTAWPRPAHPSLPRGHGHLPLCCGGGASAGVGKGWHPGPSPGRSCGSLGSDLRATCAQPSTVHEVPPGPSSAPVCRETASAAQRRTNRQGTVTAVPTCTINALRPRLAWPSRAGQNGALTGSEAHGSQPRGPARSLVYAHGTRGLSCQPRGGAVRVGGGGLCGR